jgi:N,N'-diacetylchitobiose phosphorylase
MDAVERYLSSPYGIHLLWPAYSRPDDDIGYVTRVYKGVKENASIFSHPNPWAVVAECKLGRGDRAMKYYNALLPYNQNDLIEIRQAEPYSYCQFILGRDHSAFGRARHPWLTGSAVDVPCSDSLILGVRPSYTGLIIDPCIPASWSDFDHHVAGDEHIPYRKLKSNGCKRSKTIRLNGNPIDNPIPPQPAGSINQVNIELG